MRLQKLQHGHPGFDASYPANPGSYRFAYECLGAIVATAALVFKSGQGIGLGQQHVVNRLDLVLRDIVITHEQAQVVYVMLPL